MNEEYQNRIDRYVLNRMTDDERKAFELEMAQNDELKEQTEFTMQVKQVLQDREEFKALLNKWEEGKKDTSHHVMNGMNFDRVSCSKASQIPRYATNPTKSFLSILIGIAAIVLIAIIIPSVLNLTRKPDLKDVMDIKGIETIGGTIAEQIKAGQYNLALAMIEKKEMELSEPIKTDDAFFPDDDELLDERVPNAPVAKNSPTFKGRGNGAARPSMGVQDKEPQHLQTDKSVTVDELNWLKVHALLGLGSEVEALALLEHMRKAKGLYQQKADSLYNLIKTR